MLRVTVEDSGIGIREDQKGSLFKLFSRMPEGRGMDKSGIGLGLTICKTIVQQFDGVISCESSPQEGSKFTFTFPYSLLESEVVHVADVTPSVGYTFYEEEEEKANERTPLVLPSLNHVRFQQRIEEEEKIAAVCEETKVPCNCSQVLIVDDSSVNVFALSLILKT